jgi:hypothetical protein
LSVLALNASVEDQQRQIKVDRVCTQLAALHTPALAPLQQYCSALSRAVVAVNCTTGMSDCRSLAVHSNSAAWTFLSEVTHHCQTPGRAAASHNTHLCRHTCNRCPRCIPSLHVTTPKGRNCNSCCRARTPRTKHHPLQPGRHQHLTRANT